MARYSLEVGVIECRQRYDTRKDFRQITLKVSADPKHLKESPAGYTQLRN
jgi:hypothetical protein